jgi:RNA polymerase sigma factor (sigma-70 family)
MTAELDGRGGADRHAACVRAYRAGDRDALVALVADLTPLVWHVARATGLTRYQAEDAVQSVWLALLSHMDRLAEPRALAGWLITTTRREANRIIHAREAAPPLPAPTESPEDAVLRDERDRRLWIAFNKLPQRCQELLRLTVLGGRAEYGPVADALHMPLGSIGPTRGRCLRHLRALYEKS